VVKGELKSQVEFQDLMEAMFPSGSVTGAPKKRAMEILDEVEGTVRGPYTGAMGFLGFDGSLSLNVAIRTLVLSQGICHLGVGSGIVADSDPEAEYEECVAKAKGMLAALRETPSEEAVAS
jgi:anthranilate/para-aminobenzoate synthase component I